MKKIAKKESKKNRGKKERKDFTYNPRSNQQVYPEPSLMMILEQVPKMVFNPSDYRMEVESVYRSQRYALPNITPSKLCSAELIPLPSFQSPQLKQSYICLLYTSPSPRDLSTSRMPSSA
eukprot:TRINITY_DN8028_c0_g1_i3.p1 TRINITY_DN8028_c0_g1~~TRINITY_DN8028_c0_g1_i3.p1  ORF type:complete len:120 (-),score=15.75 TRINITY_DN8028_c0_g1_i3:136-495(-)